MSRPALRRMRRHPARSVSGKGARFPRTPPQGRILAVEICMIIVQIFDHEARRASMGSATRTGRVTGARRPSKMPWHLRQALRPGLLHENIDGEALEWAGSRLDPMRWDRRIICVISDGAPVDDSTLFANEDRNLLVRHLGTIENGLRSTGTIVGFLLLGGKQVREPDLHEQATEPEAAGLSLLKLIRRALIPPAFSWKHEAKGRKAVVRFVRSKSAHRGFSRPRARRPRTRFRAAPG